MWLVGRLHFNYPALEDWNVLIQLWERDWYSSYKDLGHGCKNSKTLYYDGRRKYAHEWYLYDPSEIDPACFTTKTIQEGFFMFTSNQYTDFWSQTDKGHLKMRYEP